MTLRQLHFAALALSAAPLPACAQAHDVAAVRDAALQDKVAYEIVEGLTTEVGQRLAGTEAEARARDWAAAKLKALGFSNVAVETFQVDGWVRGEERAEIVSPFPQKLTLTALGGSGATPTQGIEAEIAYFPTMRDLRAAPEGSLAGKIAFVSHAMVPTQDGSGYGVFGDARRAGPALAAQKGARAIVIRSIGTDHHRNPHTGQTNWGDVKPIPAAALALPDAEQLERVLARGKPVRMKLVLTPKFTGKATSGNVIAEVPGSDPAAGIVLLACHLDSWDLGTGAIDDASGCGIVTAAAKHVMDAGRPRRTIRLLWAGSEEQGGLGGDAYTRAHGGDAHVVAGEADFGADRVFSFDTSLAGEAAPVVGRIALALEPLGILHDKRPSGNFGTDVHGQIEAGVAGIGLNQSGLRYFDIHHTPDDTLDKVVPDDLRQVVAAWTAATAILANALETIERVPKQP